MLNEHLSVKVSACFTLPTLETRFGTYANIADPVQTPRNGKSDQGLHWLLTEIALQIIK